MNAELLGPTPKSKKRERKEANVRGDGNVARKVLREPREPDKKGTGAFGPENEEAVWMKDLVGCGAEEL
jgi:hypothetical protein